MKIPKTLKVGGKTYVVKFPYQFIEDHEVCGQADSELNEIRLAAVIPGGAARARENIEQTFIHELLHCVDRIYNANALDEATIDRISEGLYQALRDSGMLRDK